MAGRVAGPCELLVRDRHRLRDRRRHRRGSYPDSDADANSDSDADANSETDPDADTKSDATSRANPHPGSDADAESDAEPDANFPTSGLDPDPDSTAEFYPTGDPDTWGNGSPGHHGRSRPDGAACRFRFTERLAGSQLHFDATGLVRSPQRRRFGHATDVRARRRGELNGIRSVQHRPWR